MLGRSRKFQRIRDPYLSQGAAPYNTLHSSKSLQLRNREFAGHIESHYIVQCIEVLVWSVPSLTRAHDRGVLAPRSCLSRLTPQDITVQHLQCVRATLSQRPRWHAHEAARARTDP